MARITWLGHSAIMIEENNTRILIDPFLDGCPTATTSSKELPPIDIVLVTHDHADHVGQAVEICNEHNAMLGAIVETAARLMAEGVPQSQVLNYIGFNFGGTVSHKNIDITMIPAVHTSETGLPAGYIIKLPSGLTVYHAGDTALFGDMRIWGELYSIDIACLPVGGTFTMDAKQAAYACTLLQNKTVLPMHWGTFPVISANTLDFQKELIEYAPKCQCLTLEAGQYVDIAR